MTLPPNYLPPAYSPQQQRADTSGLDVLGIFFYILAGLQAAMGLIPCIYVLFGIFVGAAGSANADNARDAHAMAAFGGMMACFGLFLAVIIWCISFLNFLAGSGLRNRKRLTLCYVMAGLACVGFPLLTVLGVLTFVNLSKPGIKAEFR